MVEEVMKSEMRRFVDNQARLSNWFRTPLISATPELLRALNLAGQRNINGKI